VQQELHICRDVAATDYGYDDCDDEGEHSISYALEVTMNSKSENHGFVCAAGDGPILPMVGQVKVSSAQTNGVFEVTELAPRRKDGPPAHVHHEHDECFYIIEGAYKFVLGTEEMEAQAGSVVFVPRGTRHAFMQNEGGRALVFAIPGGFLEGFFRELGAGMAAGRPSAELRAELARKYDSDPLE
jgi:mannose-6-phosphate isomerase-like protein (cupin superfamily)